jgi:peptidoglycan/LPS O-acetylase OafA/YrhL
MQETPAQQRRLWADVAVIFVGLALVGLAIWSPPFSPSSGVRNVVAAWQVYALSGGLSLAALVVGQRPRWRLIARLMLFAAAVILIVGLFSAFSRAGPVAWLTTVLPAVVLLAAASAVGPMPRGTER